ncbi:MAG: glutathione S-transferase family protein [Betaproteobacteria bacterium]|nr:glutathione S-transferase family protein [Betaproteobacteria bacterium]
MPKFELVIANKNYSSWSMRAWVLLRQAGIPFEEILLAFDQDVNVIGIERYSAAGKVPVLLVDGQAVWDTLAIAETVAELFPDRQLWPQDPAARRLARSACAEMHSGFQNLRSCMPMNIRAALPGVGMNADVQRDIDRIVALWRQCFECRAGLGTGGALLFGTFTIADAFFAPVAMRFTTHAVALPPDAQGYVSSLRALPAVQVWVAEARRDTRFVAGDEPYARK